MTAKMMTLFQPVLESLTTSIPEQESDAKNCIPFSVEGIESLLRLEVVKQKFL